MLVKRNKYSKLNDREWIELLLSTPTDERGVNYFFEIKCRDFLRYISSNILYSSDKREILGEFYEFISANDWHVLRLYKGRNEASLGSYLSQCAVRYFTATKNRDKAIIKIDIDSPDIIKELSLFTSEEEEDESLQPPVWKAFAKLNERDQTILRLIIIEDKSALEAADTIWPFVKSDNKDWRSLPSKRVQDTIAMLKRRALLALSLELKNIIKKEEID